MKLMQYWKSSLELLHPAQLKSFLLVTLKNVLTVYKDMNKPLTSRGNWILVGVILLLIGLTNLIKVWHMFWFESLFLNGIRFFLFFIFALGLRPSVGIKNWQYFEEYLDRFKYAFAITIILGMTPIFAIPFFLQWYMFCLFFLFDSHGTMKDIISAKTRAAKLLWYNLPLCIVLEVVLRLIGYILYSLVAFALGYWGGLTLAVILYLLVIPIEVALICNIYIKKFHEQSDIYLNQHIG